MMREEINTELRELGSSLADKHILTPFTVPQGYFAAAEQTIVNRALDDVPEIQLPAIGTPYDAPPQYFDNLPGRIQQRLPKTPKKGLLITFRQVRWAAAAMLFIMVGVGGYNMFYNQASPRERYGYEILSSVPDGDIQDYLGDTYLAEAKDNTIDKMDIPSSDIVDFLDETGWDNETF